MTEQQTEAPAAPSQVHPHPIRWDIDRQLWVCSKGCGFTRLKREGEIVPSREEAREEAARAGTGADFADLGKVPDARPGARAADQPAPSTAGG